MKISHHLISYLLSGMIFNTKMSAGRFLKNNIGIFRSRVKTIGWIEAKL